jgi:hypothetical protein
VGTPIRRISIASPWVLLTRHSVIRVTSESPLDASNRAVSWPKPSGLVSKNPNPPPWVGVLRFIETGSLRPSQRGLARRSTMSLQSVPLLSLRSDLVIKVIADRLPDDPDLSTCDTAGLPPFASQPVFCVIASNRDHRIGTMLTTRARFDAHVPPDCVIASSQRPSIRITGTNGTCFARSRSASSLPFCVISARRHPLRPVERIAPAVENGDAGRNGHARGKESIIRAA